jgi:hypothetical protein
VWPNDVVHAEPFRQQPGEPNGAPIQFTATAAGQLMDFSYTFADGWTPQHFNVAETIRRGFDFAVARRDPTQSDPIPPVAVQPTSVTGSWYNPIVDTVVINSGSAFDDLVILHEYGHYLEEQIGSFPWIPSTHDGCIATQLGSINSPEHAWMEGFADWFAHAVSRNDPLAGLTGTGSFTVSELETPSCTPGPAGDEVELFVAGTLWDLTDNAGPGEPADTQSNLETIIFQIMDRELGPVSKMATMSDLA